VSRVGVPLVLALVASAVFAAPTSAVSRFSGYAAGEATGPGHSFSVGDRLILGFHDAHPNYVSFPYNVCFGRRGAKPQCRHRLNTRDGNDSFYVVPKTPGRWVASWYLSGRRVAVWRWNLATGD
jgi:hypothetical protein